MMRCCVTKQDGSVQSLCLGSQDRTMLARYLQRRFRRLFCKYLRAITSTIIILLVLCILTLIQSSYKAEDNVDVDFYQFFDVPDDEPYRKLLANPEHKPFESGRKRIVNTTYGPVYVKDLMFVPKKPLMRGANIYRMKRPNKESSQQFSKPLDHMELDKLVKELRFSKDKKRDTLSILLDRAEPRRGDLNIQELDRAEPRRGDLNFQELDRVEPRRGDLNLQELEEDDGLHRRKRDHVNFPVNACKAPCMQYLTSSDAPHFKYCRSKSKLNPDYEPSTTTCSFRPWSPSLPLLALAGPRGSGGDILRWFVQELTGLCTGSTYCNTRLRKAGYAGECLHSTSVLLVRTDQVTPFWSGVPHSTLVPREFKKLVDVPVFDGAVYLLRNPFDALIEEWNERKLNALDEGLKWEGFVLEQTVSWQQTLLHWLVLKPDHHPAMVVRYEQLRQSPQRSLAAVLDFLHVPYSSDKLAEVSWVEGGWEELQVADYFGQKEVDYVNSILRETAEMLFHHSQTKDLNITSYCYKQTPST